jgi:hypothetical protein
MKKEIFYLVPEDPLLINLIAWVFYQAGRRTATPDFIKLFDLYYYEN